MTLTISVFDGDPDTGQLLDGLLADAFPGATAPSPAASLAQTGHRFLVAWLDEDELVGGMEWGAEEGVAWFDRLASERVGAGRALVHEVERQAQEAGCRYIRCTTTDTGSLPHYFGRMGYLPIGRETGPPPQLRMEKRLPLLTVREQRRSDAAAIAELTGEEAWPFEQGVRPGWFVLSDGERVAGAVSVRDAGGGVAAVRPPALADAYQRRGLEVWMLERAALYARTNGFHTIEAPAGPELDRLGRDLEERRWWPRGNVYRRSLADEPVEE